MALTEEQKREIEADEEFKIKIGRYSSDDYICTVCGYLGKPKNNTKGNFVLEVALWFFLIIPGIIYSLWRITNKYRGCPKCNSTAIIPLDTPNGQAIYKSLHSKRYSREKINDKEYRTQVRQKLLVEHGSSETKGNGFVYGLKSFFFSSKGAILIIVIVLIYLVNILVSQSSSTGSAFTATTVSATPTLIPAIKVAEGDFMNYRYSIAKREDAEEYAAAFSPFLQRDDTVVTGAVLEVINKIYGKHTVININPTIVERNGLNHFKFQAIDGSYYVLPVKSETGEVLLFKFWKE
jgi:hypothetical protein